MKIRRVVVIVSILTGTGFKYGPAVWHKAESEVGGKTSDNARAKTETAGRLQDREPDHVGNRCCHECRRNQDVQLRSRPSFADESL